MDVEKTRKALEKNNFKTYLVNKKEEVLALVEKITADASTFSNGGSVTLQQCKIIEFLKTKKENYYDRDTTLKEKGIEAYFELMQKANTVDVYLSGTNAITENGYLYNVDANGNRISCIMFGPKKVIIVASVNKIVADEAAAIKRVQEIAAPLNAKRLNRAVPCVKNGVCTDCQTSERLCNIAAFQKRSLLPQRIQIILVNEPLGY